MDAGKAKNINDQIGSIVSSIRSAGVDSKKPDKKIKIVYDKVHNPLLKKYELENRFHEIFSSGNYNCVTATALYALVFDQLGIPYEIKEEPTHVYLLGFPNKENIIVETTAPLFGYVTFSEDFKMRFISNLKKQKVIGNEEAEKKSTEELFNKYYFKNEKISERELIGLHYMNDALFKKDHGNWREGYYQLEKAYLFYPSQRCKYLLMAFGTEVVSKEKLSPQEKAVFVGKLSRFNEQGITADMIKGEFINLTQDLLFRDNNKTAYQDCYKILTSKIQDKDLKREIDYVYNYENGRAYYNLGNYQKAKPFFEKALTIQPNNIDLGGIFISLIGQSIRSNSDEKEVLDSLNNYKSKYPSLTQFNNFNSLLANATIANYGVAYDKNDLVTAKKHKESFDIMMKNNTDLTLVPGVIGKAYSSVCSYYFKKGLKAKAREVLEEGLKLSPDNYQLRIRLQMIR
jgi:tetratricopeptide (TPR) repeat protein